ncbi:MAG: apolipoprotein N-acyltransferase [Candidatus Kapabacteria bacterium]|nr:apolipoprotein N-acyltransferase [Candidatus Kapabacteria bacterium]
MALAYPFAPVTAKQSLPLMGLLSLCGLAPFMIVVVTRAQEWSRLQTISITYVCWFVYHALTNWWVGSWQEQTDPYLLASGIALALGHPFFLSLPWYWLVYVRKRRTAQGTLMIAPLVITAFEWLHGQTDASYPWLSFGYSLIDTPLAQSAEFIGVYGLGFIICFVNACIASMIIGMVSKRHALCAVALILIPMVTVGLFKDKRVERMPPIRVGLVQTNENPWDKWTDPRVQVQRHRDMSEKAIQGDPAIDLLVWPETAIPFAILTGPNVSDMERLRRWIDTSGVHLVTGFSDLVVYGDSQSVPPSAQRSRLDPTLRYDSFNAAMLLSPNSSTIPIHRKSCLTPFAERLPFADQLTFAMSWFEWGVGISSWGKGRTRNPLPLRLPNRHVVNLGAVICIESIYPEMVSEVVENGANVICIITNDAWYNGTPGPEQHFAIARMRAIEQRRPVVRCGLSGITGVIDEWGQEVGRVEPMTADVYVGDVAPTSKRTVYSHTGDVLPKACWLVAITALLWPPIRRLLRNMHVRKTSP